MLKLCTATSIPARCRARAAATQRDFVEGNRHALSRVETWPDGEHTIYNHPTERNALAAAWFAEALGPVS